MTNLQMMVEMSRKEKKVPIKKILKRLDITYPTLKKKLETETLTIFEMRELKDILHISNERIFCIFS